MHVLSSRQGNAKDDLGWRRDTMISDGKVNSPYAALSFILAACMLLSASTVMAAPPLIDAGIDFNCELISGTAYCWGVNTFGKASPPAGSFTQISAGGYHTCGIKTDSTVACWGAGLTHTKIDPEYGQSIAPAGSFTQISAGWYHTCGIKQSDSTVTCWGDDEFNQVTDTPVDTFTQISAGGDHTCGIKQSDSTVACWGNDSVGQVTDTPPGVTFTQISAGGGHTCGIKQSDSTVVCWGDNFYNQVTGTPVDTFTQISAGGYHTCGIKQSDSTLVCWGDNLWTQLDNIPPDTFILISAGDVHTCGVKTDETISCWGNNDLGQAPVVRIDNSVVLTTGTAGSAYAPIAITASGGTAPYTFSVISGSLPAGMTLGPDGTLSGTPSVSGSFTFTVQTMDAYHISGLKAYTLLINGGPAITSGNSTFFNAGVPGTFTVVASGPPVPALSISNSLPALPPEITFTDNLDGTATLSGTPPPGSGGTVYQLTITAANGIAPDAVQSFSLTIVDRVRRLNGLTPVEYGQNISAVYVNAAEGNTIEAQEGDLGEELTLGKPIGIILEGGYNTAFDNNAGKQTVVKKITITAGAVTIVNITIK